MMDKQKLSEELQKELNKIVEIEKFIYEFHKEYKKLKQSEEE